MVAVLVIEKDLFILYVPRMGLRKNGILERKPAHRTPLRRPRPQRVQTSFTVFAFTAMRMSGMDVAKDTPTVRASQ
jgi:hypothetical protein